MMTLKDTWHEKSYVKNILSEFFTGGETLSFQELTRGGSDRMFYRVKDSARSLILCITDNREELAFYIEFGQFFRSSGIPVPTFLCHSIDEGVVLMEDAGDVSLFETVHRTVDPDEVKELYRKTLRELFKIQRIDAGLCPSLGSRPFDYDTLRWESTYFQENLLGNYLHLSDISFLEPEFDNLARRMASQPFYPMHRDFQSQNLYIKDGSIFILDFQGARTGHLLYDVASLVKDPYADLPQEMQNQLLEWYHGYLTEQHFITEDFAHFRHQFVLISLQRLMQALGAYGFLGLKKGKKKFLEFIGPALHQLGHLVDEIDDYPGIRKIVREANSMVNPQ